MPPRAGSGSSIDLGHYETVTSGRGWRKRVVSGSWHSRRMVLLIVFAFVAGAATAVSPCVLPVLPVALAAGATGGRRRPLGVVTGLALSFTFATVALVYVIDALGLPDDLLRTLAIVVLLGVRRLAAGAGARRRAIEAWTQPRRAGAGRLGARRTASAPACWSARASGFVYAPCAGPILAGVITVSASQTFTAGRLAVALAYALGTAVVLYALMLGGRRLTRRLAPSAGRLQMAMGAVMVVVALLMLRRLRHALPDGDRGRPARRARQPDRRARGERRRSRAARRAARRPARGRRHGGRGRRRARCRRAGCRCSARRPTSPARSAGSTRPAERPLTLGELRGRGGAGRLLDLHLHQLHPHAAVPEGVGRALPRRRA